MWKMAIFNTYLFQYIYIEILYNKWKRSIVYSKKKLNYLFLISILIHLDSLDYLTKNTCNYDKKERLFDIYHKKLHKMNDTFELRYIHISYYHLGIFKIDPH